MKSSLLRISFAASLFACAYLFFPSRAPQAQSARNSVPSIAAHLHGDDEFGFITVQAANGGTTCRQLTEAEAEQMQIGQAPPVEMHELSSGLLMNRQAQQTGLKIVLRSSSQLDAYPEAKAAFMRAAARWESIIRSPITVVLDVDYGPTRFGTAWPANVIGSTGVQLLSASGETIYPAFRQALVDVASNTGQTAYYNALPADGVPTELGTTSNASGTSANLRAMEVIAPTADPDGERQLFGNPPSIGFNSSFTYDFDPSNGIDTDKLDFEAAALHEIGHALGFVTNVGNKELSPTVALFPTPWDLFRLRPVNLELAGFTTRPRISLAGGNQTFFAGEEYALSTGTVAASNGDGRQGSHWKSDELTGRYIGIMDPTAATGARDELTLADLNALLYMGYKIDPDTRAFDIQNVADASAEEAQARANALVVNRYAPARYPSLLHGLDVFIPNSGAPVGQTVRVFAFVDNNRTGQPPALNTSALIADQTFTLNAIPNTRWTTLRFNTPVTVNSGDVYIGIQTSSASVLIPADNNGVKAGRSFLSNDNGQTFAALTSTVLPNQTPVNFSARALFSATFGATVAPQAQTLSPNVLAPGTSAPKVVVTGSGFQLNSMVRFNGSARPTTYVSGSKLVAELTNADAASASAPRLTVFTPNAAESTALTLTIGSDHPTPVLKELFPTTGVLGASGAEVTVYGTNFTSQSRVRFNGTERETTFVDSTQVSVKLLAADLAGAGNHNITVTNPTPGGGASNALLYGVTGCNYSFALPTGTNFTTVLITSLNSLTTNTIESGFTVNVANGACAWNAVAAADQSWLTLPAITSGTGKSVINFRAQENPGAAPREATIMLGGQTITIRQAGRQASVPAASYTGSTLAVNSIASAFGTGLASETVAATSTPLPTTLGNTVVRVIDTNGTSRDAQLFFVSPGQVNYLVPAGTANGTATVQVRVNGSLYADGRVTIANIAPGLFTANATGKGVPAGILLRVKQDKSQVFESLSMIENGAVVARPITFLADDTNVFLVLFGSGIRDGGGASGITFKLGGLDVPVAYAGAQGSLLGVDQLNLDITALRSQLQGRKEVTLAGTMGATALNPVTLVFQ